MGRFPQALRHQTQGMIQVAARSFRAAMQNSLRCAVCSTPLAEVVGIYRLKDGLTSAKAEGGDRREPEGGLEMNGSSRKWLAAGVALLILHSSSPALAAQPAGGAVSEFARQVQRMPVDSRVEVKLKNQDRLEGRLGRRDDDGFELQVSKAGTTQAVKVAFADVQSLRHRKGMSTRAKIGLWEGIAVGMAALVAYLTLSAIGRNG